MRTQQEIQKRLSQIKEQDWLGFRSEVLIYALEFEHARPFLKDTAKESEWVIEDPDASARAYLAFAMGKINDHRGISATRSVEKLTEYAWLLERDDVIEAMEEAEYENYGAPKVKAFASTMGWSTIWNANISVAVDKMSKGLPCHEDCQDGCGAS